MSLRIASNVHARMFDGDLVILDLSAGEYYSLDPIGAHVWQGIGAGSSHDAIVKEIVNEYDTSEEVAKDDVDLLIQDLIAKRLLVEDGSA